MGWERQPSTLTIVPSLVEREPVTPEGDWGVGFFLGNAMRPPKPILSILPCLGLEQSPGCTQCWMLRVGTFFAEGWNNLGWNDLDWPYWSLGTTGMK